MIKIDEESTHDGARLKVENPALDTMASGMVVFAKLGPHKVLTCSAAESYVLAIGCLRFAVAT